MEQPQYAPAPEKKGNTTLIIIIVVVLVLILCCCPALVLGVLSLMGPNVEDIMREISRQISGEWQLLASVLLV